MLRGNPQTVHAAAQANPNLHASALALAYQAAGDEAQAGHTLQDLTAKYANLAEYQIAEVYACRGDPDQAFAWLERAWRRRDNGITELLNNPLLLFYKNHLRFAACYRKVGLPVPSSVPAAATASTPEARSLRTIPGANGG